MERNWYKSETIHLREGLPEQKLLLLKSFGSDPMHTYLEQDGVSFRVSISTGCFIQNVKKLEW